MSRENFCGVKWIVAQRHPTTAWAKNSHSNALARTCEVSKQQLLQINVIRITFKHWNWIHSRGVYLDAPRFLFLNSIDCIPLNALFSVSCFLALSLAHTFQRYIFHFSIFFLCPTLCHPIPILHSPSHSLSLTSARWLCRHNHHQQQQNSMLGI